MKDINNTQSDGDLIKLCNGRYVHPDFLDLVRFFVEERIPVLSPNTAFTLKQICGEEKWDMLDDQINKIDAGYCMVHLVDKQELPFRVVKGRHEYPKLYQLISTQLGMCIP